jgi:hypothetical protein
MLRSGACLVWTLVFGAGCPWSVLEAGTFRADVAVRIVTPDPLLPVSGGVGPSKPTREKQGELTVRALVLEDGETRLAVVATDFLGFPSALGNKVRDRVKSIPGEHVLIGASHTHSAPDCYAFPDAQGRSSADIKYLEWVCEQAAAAVNEAVAGLAPAVLRVATGKAVGKIAFNYYAPPRSAPVDPIPTPIRPPPTYPDSPRT